ncbi:MAG TPA: BMP family protein [Nakamurella sp.]|nr:BMP family protein [Nakamurella sp.]
MTRHRRFTLFAALGAALVLLVPACSSNGGAGDSSTPAAGSTSAPSSAAASSAGSDTSAPGTSGTSAASASAGQSSPAGGPSADLSSVKIAAVFSGPVTDADYNQLGLLALQAAEKQGATTTYTESVAVPDAERVIREYVADGNTVVWTHGSQFYDATAKVAKDNPDVHFIAEFDGHPDGQPDNVWIFDRQFHLGFYAIGVLASKLSKSGKVGYVGGLSLPFSYSEVHAMQQAIKDTGASTTINAVWTGDFNDPTKAQQISTQLINDGADVIVGSLNNGAVGTFKAAEAASGTNVWVTAKYTDKSSLDSGGGHYAGTVLYDFAKPLGDVLGKIVGGEGTGYYPLGFTTGVTIQMSDDVPADVQQAVSDTMAKVDDGSIKVTLDTSKIGG